MRHAIPVTFALAAALSVTATAQDSTVKSRTSIKADDAQVISMTGCLRQDAINGYTLEGTVAAAGKDLTTDSKVKTDVDNGWLLKELVASIVPTSSQRAFVAS